MVTAAGCTWTSKNQVCGFHDIQRKVSSLTKSFCNIPIRVFITHGGLLSTEEAVFHGVPLIGIPMFSDQDLNMKQAGLAGYSLTMEFGDIAGDILLNKINQILNDTT